MEFCINTLQIREGYVFTQNRLVEARHEIGVKEPPMENGQAQTTPDKLEVA
jgi:hypothetical protein